MNLRIIGTVIAREYTTKVRKKSFLLTSLLVPVVIAVGLIIMISLMAGIAPRSQQVAVVDRSGFVMPFLVNDGANEFTDYSSQGPEQVKNNLGSMGMDVLLVVSEPDATGAVTAQAYSHNPLNVDFATAVNSYINKAVEERRIASHTEVENLGGIIESIKSNVRITEYLLDKSGNESLSESGIYMMISMVMGIFIFIFITMFGGMVMSSVIEEKTSRVVEVLISSVKATELMFGKIIGVALVAFTQFLLWIGLTVVILVIGTTLTGLDLGAGADSAAMMEMAALDAQALPQGDMAVLMSTIVKIPWGTMIASFVVYFILGYLLYSSMFAAIGSAVESESDTQQLQLPLTIPLMIGYMIVLFAFKNPDSPVVVWGSMIPFTSPIVMLARIPYGVPAGELALSIAILFLSFVLLAWASAKIYRVGILMFGKKSSYLDLWNWIKQK